ncbi:T9SS type A sorting domain-containing protein [Jejuia pallidilutea]|uniref:Secretion system C-terminal sorting domain-containing protein n=1 Tax=Jejuia pallidilutea TaxID=504487 RepID=A0A090WWW1_9FLAO|nr:T9SS type A sorting domain-containing protein [Jejuia pallidilutea]GAL68016.1 hypothetical protein JCM19301_1731 [Jejuia pallidilutea]GAL71852.1 hypothetical protein JCM19302_1292 [Jejuia pallidilutea]GAL90241.1 hypothetical protein JCM19538_708 [Jejuia pallidilutea]
MKKLIFTTIIYLCFYCSACGQVTLDANGPGNTYELINAVLAPGYNVVEAPDCSHSAFGRHIDEVFDAELNTNVFRFFIHKTPDNDRCINFDRQRNEIKTYDKSPDNLLAVEGETVIYKWKFKIDAGFQPSSSFTHIHQIKSVGGPNASMPMYTLTLRKGSPDKLQLRYAETNTQTTLSETDLTPFKGTWVAVVETITYGNSGSYNISINRVSNNATLFNYSDNDIVNWQLGASIARPKWGIYRSLNNPTDLRDETVLFANFSIEEIENLDVDNFNSIRDTIVLVPNPTRGFVTLKTTKHIDYDAILLYDALGKQIPTTKRLKKLKLDVSDLNAGLYYIVFTKSKQPIQVLKCMIQ